jgi:hypothetical protein
MPSDRDHPKVPPTKANCEEDHENKLRLNAEFEKFKAIVEQAAKHSKEVEELLVPLKKLENAVLIGAHGKHFVPEKTEKR